MGVELIQVWERTLMEDLFSMTGSRHEVALDLSKQSGRKAGHKVEENRDKIEPERINWNP